MTHLEIALKLTMIVLLSIISIILYITLYTISGENRLVYIYETLKQAEISSIDY